MLPCRHWLYPFLDLFYPRVCYLCQTSLSGGDGLYLCFHCWRKLELVRGPMCRRCGMPLGPGMIGQTKCFWCNRVPFAFAEVRTAGVYQGGLRRLLLRFKFRGLLQLAEPLAAMIAWQLRRHPMSASPQVIVPVPMSARKERQRGYNQAALLAEALSRRLHLPCYSGALVKRRDTVPQSRLKHKARRSNVRHAFAISPDDYTQEIAGRVVLLVDDVLTTGSTAHACAAALRREAHATRVCVAAVARALRGDKRQ